MRKKLVYVLVIAGVLLYAPSLFGKFVWDDEDFVYANKYVAEFKVGKFLTSDVLEGRGKASNYYRPIQLLAYSSIHAVLGFNPFWFHLVNVLVHVGAGMAVFSFFVLLLDERAAFLIALLFLVHPVQSEAVSYVSGLSDPLFVLFGFLSLVNFIKSETKPRHKLWSSMFFVLSILAKETGLVFSVIIWVVWTLFFRKRKFTQLLPFIAISAVYLFIHFSYINKQDIQQVWGNGEYATSVVVRGLTFVKSWFYYLGLLVFPKDLFMERDLWIGVETKFTSLYLLGFLAINFLVVGLIWKLRNTHLSSLQAKRGETPTGFLAEARNDMGLPVYKLLVFCFLAFYISFAPLSGIILINGIFYEHFLYLPMIWVWAGLVVFFPKPKKIIAVVGVIWLVWLGMRNVRRQWDWIDPVRFYQSSLQYVPSSVRLRNGLAIAWAEQGQLELAIEEYKRAIELDPHVPNLYHNLANAYVGLGKYELAEENYQKAIAVNPKFWFAYQSLGNLYQKTGQMDKLESLMKTLRAAGIVK